MVFPNTQNIALISTSICFSIFGTIIAWAFEDIMQVLSIRGEYAAVLILSVDTSTDMM